MTARIYKPSKTAMQSGRGKTEKWILEFFQTSATKREPLMGWRSGSDTPVSYTHLTLPTNREV